MFWLFFFFLWKWVLGYLDMLYAIISIGPTDQICTYPFISLFNFLNAGYRHLIPRSLVCHLGNLRQFYHLIHLFRIFMGLFYSLLVRNYNYLQKMILLFLYYNFTSIYLFIFYNFLFFKENSKQQKWRCKTMNLPTVD